MNSSDWIRLNHEQCAELSAENFSRITFVWATKDKWGRLGVREQIYDSKKPLLHPDGRPMSICTQYLRWGFRSDGITDTHLIDLQKGGTELFLFLAPSGPVDITFEPFEQYAQRLRGFGMKESDITPELYAQSLAVQVESSFGVVPTSFDEFMDNNPIHFNAMDMYKAFLRKGVEQHNFPNRAQMRVKRPAQAAMSPGQSPEAKRPRAASEENDDMDGPPPPLESQADVRRGLGGLEAFRAVKVGRDTKWVKVDPVAPLESLEPPETLDKLLFVKPRATYYFYPEFDEDKWEDAEDEYLEQRDVYSNGKLEVGASSNVLALKHLGPYVTHLVMKGSRGGELFRDLTLTKLVAAFPNLQILDTKGQLERGFFTNVSRQNWAKIKELNIENAGLDDYDDLTKFLDLDRLSINGERAVKRA
jgi:hypothetical protein